MRKCFLLAFILSFTAVLFSACSSDTAAIHTEPCSEFSTSPMIQGTDILWEVDPSCGGYSFETDSMRAVLVVNGGYQYVFFHSVLNDHTIQVYFTPTETVVLNTQHGVTSYYTENYEDEKIIYQNPMVQILNGFVEQEFISKGEVLLDGKLYTEHCAIQTFRRLTIPKEEYTLYTIQTKWHDGESYLFQYQVFADGATMLVGNAPEELNGEKEWIIDLEKEQIRNDTTQIAIPVSIVAISTGQGISPWNDEKITVEVQYFSYLYTDPHTGRIEKFQMVKDTPGALVNVLQTAEITLPEITNEMNVMDEETLGSVLMLVSMLEYIFD